MSFLCCPLKTLTLCPSIAYTAIGYLKEAHIYLCIWNTVWDRNTNHNSGCFHSRKSEPEFMFFFCFVLGFFCNYPSRLKTFTQFTYVLPSSLRGCVCLYLMTYVIHNTKAVPQADRFHATPNKYWVHKWICFSDGLHICFISGAVNC